MDDYLNQTKRTFGFLEEDVIALLPERKPTFFYDDREVSGFNKCRDLAIQNIKAHFAKLNQFSEELNS